MTAMSHTVSSILTLSARHFSSPRGKAYPVTVRHPEVVARLWAGMSVRLWTGEAWAGRSAKSVEDVVNGGDGLCFVEVREIWLRYPFDCDPGASGVSHLLATVWISLPGDVDPRTLESGLILDLEPDSTASTANGGGGGKRSSTDTRCAAKRDDGPAGCLASCHSIRRADRHQSLPGEHAGGLPCLPRHAALHRSSVPLMLRSGCS